MFCKHRIIGSYPVTSNSRIETIVLHFSRSVRKTRMRVFARSSIITKAYLSKVVEVHIGNRFVELEVNKKMVGGKFGNYAMTKRLGSYIHKKKKKKKFKKMASKKK